MCNAKHPFGRYVYSAPPHPAQPSGSVPVDLDLGDLHEVSAQIGLIVACQLTGDDADEAGLLVALLVCQGYRATSFVA